MAQATTWYTGGGMGGLRIHHGIHPSVAKLELELARIAQSGKPNRTPSAAHVAHLNRTGGAGGGGGGGFGTGGGAPSSGFGGQSAGEAPEAVAIQGLNIPGNAIPALAANVPPVQSLQSRRLSQSDLASFLKRGFA